MNETARVKPELPSLTGLRAIAALWVLCFHAMLLFQRLHSPLAIPFGLVGGAGYMGVDLFFVLSGFVIAYNYADVPRWTPRHYGQFLWKRLARIYPVHLAGLALLAVVWHVYPPTGAGKVSSVEGLVRSVALVHAWSIPVIGTWNSVSWSVSLEWAAYIAFPILACVTARIRSWPIIAASLVALFVALSVALQSNAFPGTMAFGVYRIVVEFSAGVLLFRLWTVHRQPLRPAWPITILALLLFGGTAVEVLLYRRAAMHYLPGLAAVAVFCLACSPQTLHSAALQYLGRISYSLYIVHGVVLRATRLTVDRLGLAPAWGLAGVAAAILLAAVFYHWLEKPARRWMLGFSRGRGGRPLARDSSPRDVDKAPSLP